METEPLAKACELAFAVARQGVEANPPIEPPAAMRSFLYVPQLPRRAITVAQRVIEEDPAFRARVAAQATETTVGEAGYRWLHRPNGWDSDQSPAQAPLPDLPKQAGEAVPAPQSPRPAVPPPAPPGRVAAAPSGSVPPPPPPPPSRTTKIEAEQATSQSPGTSAANASIEEELASLRGLVARLADERQPADDPAGPIEQTLATSAAAPIVQPEPEPTPPSTIDEGRRTALENELEQARQDRDRAQAERQSLLTHQGELEIELAEVRATAERATQDASRARADIEQTQSDLAQARLDAETAEAKVADLVSAEGDLRNQIDAAVVDRDAAWSEAGAIRIERDQLEDRVRVAEQARVDLEAQLDEVSSQWQDLKVDNQTLAAERDAARRSFDDLSTATQAAAGERRALFNELATQLGQVEAERDHLASQIERMQAQLSGTRAALDTANQTVRGELDSAEAAATSSVDAIGRLDASLGSAHERLANLDTVIDEGPSARAAGAADTEPATVPTQPPTPPSHPTAPGEVGGDVEIDAFLPEGVEVENRSQGGTETVRADAGSSDATLFGNPRDVHDRGLFADRVVEERTSADDDQALANVMASYGFGADDDAAEQSRDEHATVEDATVDDATVDDGDTFDVSDTSSFIDPDHGQAPAGQTADEPETRMEETAQTSDDSHARRVATTPDMVMLVDGDAAASMGWRESSVVDRRRYLLEKLDQVTGEYGPALDVVFDAAVGGEDQLPAPTKVRRRLIQAGTSAEEKLSELVDSYPSHFPIAVVSDQPGLRDQLRLRSVETLEVVELLDLIIGLPEQH